MSVGVHAQAVSEAKTLSAGEIKLGANPALPEGVTSAVLVGDPAQGPFVVRVQLAPNARIMPHSHHTENVLTVLSGTLLYGEGFKFDRAKLKPYPAGSLIVEKPNEPHFMTSEAVAVFQVSVPGKASFDYVDPEHDPRNK